MTANKCIVRASRAFTLIELLVVIAIIGILSAVVLASLGTARERALEANIRATLKNMSAEVELQYESTGNYNFINTNCTATSTMLGKFVSALQAQGAGVGCYSHSQAGDVYQRWGVAVSLSGSATPLVAFAVSQEGVIKFDDTNTTSAVPWGNAASACASASKRLPTPEQLRALYQITNTNPVPGFNANAYWSSILVPGQTASWYGVNMATGDVTGGGAGYNRFARCGV